LVFKDDGWRIPDALWAKMEPSLPVHVSPAHPLGCHRHRVSNRAAMDAILFVLRTGCQWNALNGSGICSSSSAYRRFREWLDAGVFERFWQEGLLEYDRLQGIDWAWLSVDGAMTKAPLGGEKTGPNPTDRGKTGVKRSVLTDGRALPLSLVTAGANRHDMKLLRSGNRHGATRRPPRRGPCPAAGRPTPGTGTTAIGPRAAVPPRDDSVVAGWVLELVQFAAQTAALSAAPRPISEHSAEAIDARRCSCGNRACAA
jgi:transposase